MNKCVSLLFHQSRGASKRWERLVEPLKPFLDEGIKFGPFGIDWQSGASADWREVGDALGKVLDEADIPWLICVDEVPVSLSI